MNILIKFLIFSVFSLTILTKPSFGKNPSENPRVDEYFEVLAKENVDFEPTGTICERVAVKELDSLYPSVNYEIINSIRYDDKKTTIGELDLVVLDKATGNVEAVGEVKCWKSFKGGLKKAREQRMRFLNYLNKNITLEDLNGKRYSRDLFFNIQKFFTVSQAGGINQGFDFELSLNLKELMDLRNKLLDCKAQGRCPRK